MSVVATRWLGYCDRCGAPAPEERDSEEQAQQDIDECPCRDEDDSGGAQ